jgi:hypothetical protein
LLSSAGSRRILCAALSLAFVTVFLGAGRAEAKTAAGGESTPAPLISMLDKVALVYGAGDDPNIKGNHEVIEAAQDYADDLARTFHIQVVLVEEHANLGPVEIAREEQTSVVLYYGVAWEFSHHNYLTGDDWYEFSIKSAAADATGSIWFTEQDSKRSSYSFNAHRMVVGAIKDLNTRNVEHLAKDIRTFAHQSEDDASAAHLFFHDGLPFPNGQSHLLLGLAPNETKTGAMVTLLYPYGPAAKAGILRDDTILAINGHPTVGLTVEQLSDLILKQEAMQAPVDVYLAHYKQAPTHCMVKPQDRAELQQASSH